MNVRVLVPISGGKDSQACLKLALQHYPASEVRGLFCDTQWEHPDTYAHVERLRTLYGEVRIDRVSEGSVLGQCVRFGRFPGGGARHCTDYLKIRPTRRYCVALAEEQREGFEVWYGMRTGESAERATRYAGKESGALYMPHEVLPGKYPQYLGHRLGVRFRLPFVDWSTDDLVAWVGRKDLNPLYEHFDRVGCFPCGAGGDKAKDKAFAHDDFGRQQRERVVVVMHQIGKNFWTSKSGRERNADACALVCGE